MATSKCKPDGVTMMQDIKNVNHFVYFLTGEICIEA